MSRNKHHTEDKTLIFHSNNKSKKLNKINSIENIAIRKENYKCDSLFSSSLEKQDIGKDYLLPLIVSGSSQDTIDTDPFNFSSHKKSLEYSDKDQQNSGDKCNIVCESDPEKEIDLNNSSLIFQEKNEKLKNYNRNNSVKIGTQDIAVVPADSLNDEIQINHQTIKALKGNHVESSKVDFFHDSENDSTLLNQCPICFKSVSKYVSHIKSCAAKNKISTQQLLEAVKLQKKQLAERKALGLGIPAQSFRAKVSPKRSKTNIKKGPKDSSLELALALSESLRSAEDNDVIQQAEVLKEAGLSQEAHQKLSILENFGFHSALSVTSQINGTSKAKPLSSTLLRRTQEERERIITEKVAIVLINEEVTLDHFEMVKEPFVESKSLKEIWISEAKLWAQAHCDIGQERDAFYVQSLSAFVSPSRAEVGQDMRHLSQLPGRMNTPDLRCVSDLQTTKKHAHPLNSGTEKPSNFPDALFKLVKDWGGFVDNSELSDVTIRCKDSESVSAHKLVFYVRCPSILTQIVQDDSKDILIWDSCSKTAVVALLDYIYTACVSKLSSLEKEDLIVLGNLSKTINNDELKNMIDNLQDTEASVCSVRLCNPSTKRKLFEGVSDYSKKDLNKDLIKTISSHSFDDRFSPDSSYSNNTYDPHQQAPISPDFVDVRSERESPDMFDETKVTYHSSTQDDLQMLASLVGKTTLEINSLSEKLDSSTTSKRKLSDSSSSDENISLVKRNRFEFVEEVNKDDKLSHLVASGTKDEEVFDLTQSSKSSNEEVKSDGQVLISDDRSKEHRNSGDNEEYIGDLTQMDPPLSPNIPSLETGEEIKNSICEDNADQVDLGWCEYDNDYWQYNYDSRTPLKLPQTPDKKSAELKEFDVIKCLPVSISSNSVSSQKLSPSGLRQSLSLSTPKSKSPNQYKQRTLLYNSPAPDQLKSTFINDDLDKSLNLSNSSLSNDVYKSQVSTNSLNRESSKYSKNKNVSSQNIDTKRQHSQEILDISKKNSLDSMQRLLDDTFEVNDSLFLMAETVHSLPSNIDVESNSNPSLKLLNMEQSCSLTQPGSSKICEPYLYEKNIVKTPSQDIIVCDNVTPLPNYSAMKTPFLKKELTKFGIKPNLGKRKGKMLLRYIYDQTHPVIPIKEQPETQVKGPPVKIPSNSQDGNVDLESESESEDNLSQNNSSGTGSTLMEESCDLEELDGYLTQETQNNDVQAAIRSLILEDSELHRKVVMYEAIFLEDLMKMIKEKKIRAKADEVKKFLDDQCITFRTKTWAVTNNRRRQRSPKKKTNKIERHITLSQGHQNINNLQISNPTNVPKKRGRPRKTTL